jgi:hypothetical protein
MKVSFDKNFLVHQLCLLIIFILINTLLVNNTSNTKHFSTSSSNIKSSDIVVYTIGQQFGIQGSTMFPVSKLAILSVTLQRFVMVAYVAGYILFDKSMFEYDLFNDSVSTIKP